MLRVAARPLPARLASLANGCYGYEERSQGPLVRSEFANARVVMILETGPPLRVSSGGQAVSHGGGFVAGIHDGPTRTEHAGHQAGVQLNLPPLAARLVLGIPLAEIAHRVVAATDALPRAGREIALRLPELPTWEARLDAVEELLASAFERKQPASFRELAWATQKIECSAGRVQVRTLARELGWSERRLQRAFAEQIGVSPKLFARLVRFQALMARIRASTDESWASVALALGFADQSHLARDVRQFSGVTPSVAERSQLQSAVATA